jgi:hypothetical protein
MAEQMIWVIERSLNLWQAVVTPVRSFLPAFGEDEAMVFFVVYIAIS